MCECACFQVTLSSAELTYTSEVYQGLAKEAVLSHLKAEQEAGKEIHPAFAGLTTMDQESNEADKSK